MFLCLVLIFATAFAADPIVVDPNAGGGGGGGKLDLSGTDLTTKYCEASGKDCKGADIEAVFTPTISQCISRCNRNTACLSTFFDDERICHLRGERCDSWASLGTNAGTYLYRLNKGEKCPSGMNQFVPIQPTYSNAFCMLAGVTCPNRNLYKERRNLQPYTKCLQKCAKIKECGMANYHADDKRRPCELVALRCSGSELVDAPGVVNYIRLDKGVDKCPKDRSPAGDPDTAPTSPPTEPPTEPPTTDAPKPAVPSGCKKTKMGTEYNGRLAVTKNNHQCQRWDAQSPQKHSRTNAAKYPDATLTDAANYCRNPDGEPNGPWCYTTDPNKRWESCDVPMCPPDTECKETKSGLKYRGQKSVTKSGFTCQRWDAQTPHEHNRKDASKYPDATLADAANYCRNPDNEPNGPWCYTTDKDKRWEHCDLKICAEETFGPDDCRYTKMGERYNGKLRKTKEGLKCQRWDAQTPHAHTRTNAAKYPEATLTDAENYCRNPDRSAEGPWCYTTDSGTRWQYCDVPMCPPGTDTSDCRDTTMGLEYKGKISVTKNGRSCQRWDAQAPHAHTRKDASKYPDATLADAADYCRNPDNEPNGPWCYTTDSDKRWEYCDVPMCPKSDDDACRETKRGREYKGHTSTTVNGRTCQRWDSQSPNKHKNTNANNYPDATLVAATNYCRNPDNEPNGPWCYTTDKDKRWEYCDVPMCPEKEAKPQPNINCVMTKLGVEYKGQKAVTVNGRECQRWDAQSPHAHTRNNIAKFPETALADAANYCRNPDDSSNGPWCYTTDKNKRWDYCGIPKCPEGSYIKDVTCRSTKIGIEYKGKVAATKNGRTCQRWDAQTPHDHTKTNPAKYPDATLTDAVNYCRNPDREPHGPWCYTTESDKRWEYCDVPLCP